MRFIVIFFVIISPLFSSSQPSRLAGMTGEWKIEASMFSPAGEVVQSFSGNATWETVYNGRYVHEKFEFEFRGNKVSGEAFLGETKMFNRYEFVQVDNANPVMFMLTGNWNDSASTLELSNVAGSVRLKWQYVFLSDGSFVKKMLVPKQGTSEYYVQSAYHYKKKK